MPRFTLPAAVHLLLRKEGKVLLLLRQNTGWMNGHYSLVAGHLDGQERAIDAMIREAKEEAGITLRPEDLAFVCVIHRLASDAEYVDFFYEASHWEGDITNTEPHKCGGLTFFPVDDLPPNIVPYIRAGIEAMLTQTPYIEFGWE